MKTIGYVCERNPFEDRHAWSGTIYKMRQAIENAGYKVVWIPSGLPQLEKKFITTALRIAFGRHTVHHHNRYILRAKARRIDHSLVDKCDYIFFPGGIVMAAFYEFHRPIIYFSDTTAKLMYGYYWTNQSQWIVHEAHRLEGIGISKASLCIGSSDWMVDSLVNDYQCPSSKTSVIEFGANIEDANILDGSTATFSPVHVKTGDTINILFSGVDWQRKGGDIAVETVRLLNERGHKAFLDVVGIRALSKSVKALPFVRYHGFLDKCVKEEYRRYLSLWRHSHIFLLPTRAECSATVYCEAAAFGVPVFTYQTGGTANYVRDGYNGRNLQVDAQASTFADVIVEALETDMLPKYSANARSFYSERLSWEAWTQRFQQLMLEKASLLSQKNK